MIDEALGPLQERQAVEAAELEDQIERFGLRGPGQGDLETRHKREVRRFRTAELRFGLATLAAATARRCRRGVPRRSSTPSPASTRPRWRWTATPTRPCCSRRSSPSSPTSTSTSA